METPTKSHPTLSGGMTEIMFQVISDCYVHHKESDHDLYLNNTNQTFLEWKKWVEKRMTQDFVFQWGNYGGDRTSEFAWRLLDVLSWTLASFWAGDVHHSTLTSTKRTGHQ